MLALLLMERSARLLDAQQLHFKDQDGRSVGYCHWSILRGYWIPSSSTSKIRTDPGGILPAARSP